MMVCNVGDVFEVYNRAGVPVELRVRRRPVCSVPLSKRLFKGAPGAAQATRFNLNELKGGYMLFAGVGTVTDASGASEDHIFLWVDGRPLVQWEANTYLTLSKQSGIRIPVFMRFNNMLYQDPQSYVASMPVLPLDVLRRLGKDQSDKNERRSDPAHYRKKYEEFLGQIGATLFTDWEEVLRMHFEKNAVISVKQNIERLLAAPEDALPLAPSIFNELGSGGAPAAAQGGRLADGADPPLTVSSSSVAETLRATPLGAADRRVYNRALLGGPEDWRAAHLDHLERWMLFVSSIPPTAREDADHAFLQFCNSEVYGDSGGASPCAARREMQQRNRQRIEILEEGTCAGSSSSSSSSGGGATPRAVSEIRAAAEDSGMVEAFRNARYAAASDALRPSLWGLLDMDQRAAQTFPDGLRALGGGFRDGMRRALEQDANKIHVSRDLATLVAAHSRVLSETARAFGAFVRNNADVRLPDGSAPDAITLAEMFVQLNPALTHAAIAILQHTAGMQHRAFGTPAEPNALTILIQFMTGEKICAWDQFVAEAHRRYGATAAATSAPPPPPPTKAMPPPAAPANRAVALARFAHQFLLDAAWEPDADLPPTAGIAADAAAVMHRLIKSTNGLETVRMAIAAIGRDLVDSPAMQAYARAHAAQMIERGTASVTVDPAEFVDFMVKYVSATARDPFAALEDPAPRAAFLQGLLVALVHALES